MDARHDRAAAESLGRSARFVGSSRRFATAGSIAWTRDDVVVVAYLLTSSIVTYKVTGRAGARTLQAIAEVSDLGGMADYSSIAASADGHLVCVTSSKDGRVGLLSVDTDGAPHPPSLVSFRFAPDRNVHGVAFSPDSRYLVYTAVDDPGGLRILSVDTTEAATVGLRLVHAEINNYAPLKPKGVTVTSNGRFVVVSYGGNSTASPGWAKPGFVVVREWDRAAGGIGPVVSRSGRRPPMSCAEDVCVDNSDGSIVVVDQSGDGVFVLSVDPESGVLGEGRKLISWSAGGLQAPHGCAVSPDGSTLAVTNYGDGSVRFFRTSDLIKAAHVHTPASGM